MEGITPPKSYTRTLTRSIRAMLAISECEFRNGLDTPHPPKRERKLGIIVTRSIR